ncbi:unnamed protein product [Sphagnum jensenii]|uniref:Uncharacterized protein n=1 Tax=Sphagnum jensenii TaxID=128206 RepID=A0ABP1A3R4_9BRYO
MVISIDVDKVRDAAVFALSRFVVSVGVVSVAWRYVDTVRNSMEFSVWDDANHSPKCVALLERVVALLERVVKVWCTSYCWRGANCWLQWSRI